MRRTLFNEDHEAFRETIRDFIQAEVAPVYEEWEQAGHPPRDFYNKLGELGVFGIQVPGKGSHVGNAESQVDTDIVGDVLFGAGDHVELAVFRDPEPDVFAVVEGFGDPFEFHDLFVEIG